MFIPVVPKIQGVEAIEGAEAAVQEAVVAVLGEPEAAVL